jgi:hypothetical protein
MELTHGRGADACIDAVGTEPKTSASFDSVLDRAKVALFMGTDRPHVLRQAIHCCRNWPAAYEAPFDRDRTALPDSSTQIPNSIRDV